MVRIYTDKVALWINFGTKRVHFLGKSTTRSMFVWRERKNDEWVSTAKLIEANKKTDDFSFPVALRFRYTYVVKARLKHIVSQMT